MAQRIILDTDIGTNVDDALALILALASPEIEVMGVTIVSGDVDARVGCAQAVLSAYAEVDPLPYPIPLVPGARTCLDGGPLGRRLGYEGTDLGHAGRKAAEACTLLADTTAAEFICRCAQSQPRKVDLVAIGPLTDVALALRLAGGADGLPLGRIVCMGGALYGWGEEHATREHNFASDIPAAVEVLTSGLPVYVVGLNVTRELRLSQQERAAIRASQGPLSRLISTMTSAWLRAMRRSVVYLHDPLAVAVEVAPGLVRFRPATALPERRDETYTNRMAFAAAGEESPLRVAESVDRDGFHRLFRRRVLNRLTVGVPRQSILFPVA